MTFNIEFDYRFDDRGFFNDPIRKSILEYAASIWESNLNDDFTTIPTGQNISVPIITQYFGVPVQITEQIILSQPIDDLLIFVYSEGLDGSISPFATQVTLGKGQPVELTGSYDHYNSDDFEPRLGTIAFNNSFFRTSFFFDTTPQTIDDIPKDQYDFLSTAVHEIGHVLGIGSAPAFKRQVSNQAFNGVISRSLNGGNPIPLTPDSGHIKEGFTLSPPAEDLMDPILTGQRQLPSPLDLALLADIGYQINTSLKDKLTTPIIRFQNIDKPGTYLFAGEQEAASIRQNYKGFKEEGLAFQVAVNKDDPLMQPFYRFQNTTKGREGTYLFADEKEAISIRQNYKNFEEEGLAFYAYSAGVGGGTTDFARFQNKNAPGTYLFTGPSETSSVLTNFPGFTLEGSAFAAG